MCSFDVSMIIMTNPNRKERLVYIQTDLGEFECTKLNLNIMALDYSACVDPNKK